MKNFLLRFEEKSVQEDATASENRSGQTAVVASTQTLTEVRAEGTDKDPNSRCGVAFPDQALMDHPFILGFQETCALGEEIQANTGTQTMTNVKGGDIDTDRDRRFEAFGRAGITAGTHTKTLVASEHDDTDPGSLPFSLIPSESTASLGTNTMTRVQGEGGDTDPGARQLRVIPTCFSS
jgi:hypothetical protein